MSPTEAFRKFAKLRIFAHLATQFATRMYTGSSEIEGDVAATYTTRRCFRPVSVATRPAPSHRGWRAGCRRRSRASALVRARRSRWPAGLVRRAREPDLGTPERRNQFRAGAGVGVAPCAG